MLPTLRRYGQSPFDLMRDFDRMLGWPGETAELERTAAYPCDIRETSENLVVEAELPGFKKDDIDVSVEQGVLTISAHREEEKQEGEQHLHERSYHRVQRRFTLPTTVDAEKVDAHLDNGVLTLTMPKKEEVRPRKIEVK
jgi:HSP20 family protein